MANLTVTQTIVLCQKARKDARAWHESGGVHSAASLDIFEAGFSDGWSKCLHALKLHGYQFDDSRGG